MPFIRYDPERLHACAAQIVTTAHELSALEFTPATSGNFSMRLDDRHVAITVSGREKSDLSEADVMVVDLEGAAVSSSLCPSAETLLHTQLYRRLPAAGCVLHTHSLAQTLASRVLGQAGAIRLANYELLKAFSGISRHDTAVDVAVLANDQDMGVLAAQVERILERGPAPWGYLIESHGLYVWGADMFEARRHLAAFEFLLKCELHLRKYRP